MEIIAEAIIQRASVRPCFFSIAPSVCLLVALALALALALAFPLAHALSFVLADSVICSLWLYAGVHVRNNVFDTSVLRIVECLFMHG